MATEAYPFYAYWNGEQVSDLWTTIAAMTSTSDYRTLLICVAVGGFLAVMMGAAVRYRGQDAIAWCAATLLLFSVAFVPRININVLDVRGGYTQVIKDIPIGIGWPASTISRISYWLTQTFETAFNDVDATSYTRFGMAFPQRVVTSVLALKPMTEYGRVSLVNFAERCIVPEILDNPTKRQALMTAPDIYALISTQGWVNPARRVMIADQVQTCPAALETLRDALEKHELPALESMLVTRLSQTADDVVTGSVRAAIPNAEAVMLGVSRSLTESLRQSVMMAAIPQATMNTAAKAGQAPLTAGVAMARAQGNLASEINYRTLSEMAKSALPKLRNLLEFIVIGLFPITFLLAIGLGTGGVIVIRAYFTLLISVSLWAPITAIMNYLMIHVDAEPMNRMVEAAGGVTLAAATMIREGGATSQAMAGSLMWLVPVLSYAVAKGSDMALTSMASSVLAPASSAAQSQGATLAAGNVAAGNASLSNLSANNVSANKTDLSSAYGDTNRHTSTSAYGTWQGDRSTGAVTAMTVANTELGTQSVGMYTKQTTSGTLQSDITQITQGNMSTKVEGTTLSEGQKTANTKNEKDALNKIQSDGTTNIDSTVDQFQTGFGFNKGHTFGEGGQVNEVFGNSSGLNASGRGLISKSLDEIFGKSTHENTSTTITSGLTQPGLVQTSDGFKLALPDIQNGKSKVPEDMLNYGSGFNIGINGTTQGFRNEVSNQSTSSTDSKSFMKNSSKTTTNNVSDTDTYQKGKDVALANEKSSGLMNNKSIQNQKQATKGISNQNGVTYTRNDQGNISTNVNLGNQVRDYALNKFQNPIDALEQLNNADTRLHFGSEVKQLMEGNDLFTTSIENNVPNRNFKNIGTEADKASFEKEHQANQAALSGNFVENVDQLENEKQIKAPSRPFMPPNTAAEKEDLFLRKGIVEATSNEFIEKNTGAISVMLLSYLGGLGHDSPEKISNNLLEASQTNPLLRNELIELGKRIY